MKALERCPVCGGELIEKEVEKILRGGNHTAIIHVQAEVCQGCGERLYDEVSVKRFEEIRSKLERQETDQFEVLGQSFQIS